MSAFRYFSYFLISMCLLGISEFGFAAGLVKHMPTHVHFLKWLLILTVVLSFISPVLAWIAWHFDSVSEPFFKRCVVASVFMLLGTFFL